MPDGIRILWAAAVCGSDSRKPRRVALHGLRHRLIAPFERLVVHLRDRLGVGLTHVFGDRHGLRELGVVELFVRPQSAIEVVVPAVGEDLVEDDPHKAVVLLDDPVAGTAERRKDHSSQVQVSVLQVVTVHALSIAREGRRTKRKWDFAGKSKKKPTARGRGSGENWG